jgi:hypothetical protein
VGPIAEARRQAPALLERINSLAHPNRNDRTHALCEALDNRFRSGLGLWQEARRFASRLAFNIYRHDLFLSMAQPVRVWFNEYSACPAWWKGCIPHIQYLSE